MKLEGFESLQRALVSAPEVVRVHSSSAVAASAFAVAARARALAPIATGALRRSITNTKTVSGLVGNVGISDPQVDYWRFVEFGTRYMAARPFFRPAAESEREGFIQRMRQIGPRLERDLSTGRFT